MQSLDSPAYVEGHSSPGAPQMQGPKVSPAMAAQMEIQLLRARCDVFEASASMHDEEASMHEAEARGRARRRVRRRERDRLRTVQQTMPPCAAWPGDGSARC